MKRAATLALLLFVTAAAPAGGHGGARLAGATGGGLSAQLFGSVLPADQSPDGRERVDYTVQVREGRKEVVDAVVTLEVDKGRRTERQTAKAADGTYEVLVMRDEADWRRWPARLKVERGGVTLAASYKPPDEAVPSWLPYTAVFLVPLLLFAGSRLVRQHRGSAES